MEVRLESSLGLQCMRLRLKPQAADCWALGVHKGRRRSPMHSKLLQPEPYLDPKAYWLRTSTGTGTGHSSFGVEGIKYRREKILQSSAEDSDDCGGNNRCQNSVFQRGYAIFFFQEVANECVHLPFSTESRDSLRVDTRTIAPCGGGRSGRGSSRGLARPGHGTAAPRGGAGYVTTPVNSRAYSMPPVAAAGGTPAQGHTAPEGADAAESPSSGHFAVLTAVSMTPP